MQSSKVVKQPTECSMSFVFVQRSFRPSLAVIVGSAGCTMTSSSAAYFAAVHNATFRLVFAVEAGQESHNMMWQEGHDMVWQEGHNMIWPIAAYTVHL